MKKQLETDLAVALAPYVKDQDISTVKMIITMTLSDYEVTKPETALTVYEGDINELIIMKWLSAKLAAGCSKRTVKQYKDSVTLSLSRIGKAYQDITADDVRAYLATRIFRDGVSKTTANNERRNLSAFYYWLQKEEILLKNPMNRVDPIKVTKKKKQAFSQMDIEKMRYACMTTRETAILEILLSTWCRVSELAEIRIADIHGDAVTVHGKGDKYRECYLNAKAQMALQKYLDDREDENPYLLPRAKHAGNIQRICPKGSKQKELAKWYMHKEQVDEEKHLDPGTIESIIRKIGTRADVTGAHPHRFRRTGATMALRSGMPLIQVSKLLGHEQIDTTQIYLDISDEELMQAHNKYVT